MLYPQEIIEEVRMQNDIAGVIGQYVSLSKRGSSHVGLCPFHREKTPSFHVNQEKQVYHCFGCGASGNVFSFVMQMENDTFPEAVKKLADRAHITLPEADASGEYKKKLQLKQTLIAIHKKSARFYYDLLHSAEGKQALTYLLEERKLSPKIQNKFGIGYAPASVSLYNYLKKEGYSDELLEMSGLVIKKKRKDGYYDRFFNRVMFPIIDVSGNIIAFGGRVLGKGEPKYLNSPETLLFNKSKVFYGMNFAKQTSRKGIILVEGYMDVASLHQAGFRQAVAALGTAFNQSHAYVLKKYTDKVILLFDSDAAGVNASLRAIPVLVSNGIAVKVASVPEGKDPDEFVMHHGPEAFTKVLQDAKSHIAFQLQCIQDKYDLNQLDEKVAFTTEVAGLLSKVDNAIEQDAYVKEIAQVTQISRQAIEREMQKRQNTVSLPEPMLLKPRTPQQNQPQSVPKEILDAEKNLLQCMALGEKYYRAVIQHMKAEEFSSPVHQKVYHILGDIYKQKRNIFAADVVSFFEEPEEQKQATEIFVTSEPIMPETDIQKQINTEVKLIKSENNKRNTAYAASTNDDIEFNRLLEEKALIKGLNIIITDG